MFGVPFALDREVHGLAPTAPGGAAPTEIHEADPEEALAWGDSSDWPEVATVPPRSQFPDAERVLVVGRDDSRGGFRLWSRGGGDFLVSRDGMSVRTHSRGVVRETWERILLAQVLPLVAALRGHELLHASGVLVDDTAIALVGPSGIGKSTFSRHLVDRGGTLIADDVLSLVEEGDHVLAHPGPAIAHLGSGDGHDKKRLTVATTTMPVRVGSVYFLQRVPAGSPAEITPVDQMPAFMANAFVNYVSDADRLTRQLSLYSVLSRSARVYRAAFPVTTSTEALASHLLRPGETHGT